VWWERGSSFIFSERWLFALAKKINVLDRALTFLVQMLNFSTIFALLTTGYMFIKIHVYLKQLRDKRMFLSS
jgi:hypothetical protein